MRTPKVIISILNWNTSAMTIACAKSVLALRSNRTYELELVIIDNGSVQEQWVELKNSFEQSEVRLIRNETNLGFAGGHNVAIRLALGENADYVWLVNSDAVVKEGSLEAMLQIIDNDPSCGAVSPLILGLDDESVIDFCGARHDWRRLVSVPCASVDEAVVMEAEYPADMWLMGAAIMLRTNALRQVGLLDEDLFAYYEDNDICARLSKSGWTCRMAFNAVVLHCCPKFRLAEKKSFYFYLMARNSFIFWLKHTPSQYRRFLKLKLIDRELLVANRLHSLGLEEKKAACLLGISDGHAGKVGKWNLDRRASLLMQLLRKLLWKTHFSHLRI